MMRTLLFLVFSSIFFHLVSSELTAKIVSCPACTLNKHKELRLFLKGDGKGTPGEITEYAGVTIDWIRGKKAVMTIYENGVQQGEPVQLYELKTRTEMHKLMLDKGFHVKTQQDKMEEVQVERREAQLKQVGDGNSFYGQMIGIYVLAIVVVGAIAMFFNGRRKKSRSSAMISRV